MTHSLHIEELIRASENECLAIIYYRKGVTKTRLKPRLVEPYGLVDGKQDMMYHCFQLQHGEDEGEAGWRFFMTHKIEQVECQTVKFKPRRRIRGRGEVSERYESDPHWESEGRRIYRDIVGDALADGAISPHELFDIDAVKSKYRLTLDDVRFVHASIYQRCLTAAIQDGFVAQEEVDEIRFLHRVMQSLGWCVGD